MESISVAIDARLPDSAVGGVQQVVMALGSAFAARPDLGVQTLWIVWSGTSWWRPFVPVGANVLKVNPPVGNLALLAAKYLPAVASRVRPLLERWHPTVDGPLDAQLRANGVQLVHMPFQDGFSTSLPFVYNPHDFQDRYLPELFTKAQIRHRDTVWRRFGTAATRVVVESRFVHDDAVNFWAVDAMRIVTVPTPPPDVDVAVAEPSHAQVRQSLSLLYPAAFWPHKNHLRLIEAVARLHKQGLPVRLILTGAKQGQYKRARRAVRRNGLRQWVEFRGHISRAELLALYASVSAVVIPTLFESISLPIWEAFAMGVPVACSNVCGLPEQVGEAALLFDPTDTESIAATLDVLLRDSDLQQSLTQAGHQRVSGLTLSSFAEQMASIYRSCLRSRNIERNGDFQ